MPPSFWKRDCTENCDSVCTCEISQGDFFFSPQCMFVNTLFGSEFLRLQQRLFVAPSRRTFLFHAQKDGRRDVLPKQRLRRTMSCACNTRSFFFFFFWRAVSGRRNGMLYKTAWKKVCQNVALLFSYCNELYGCLSNIMPLCRVSLFLAGNGRLPFGAFQLWRKLRTSGTRGRVLVTDCHYNQRWGQFFSIQRMQRVHLVR